MAPDPPSPIGCMTAAAISVDPRTSRLGRILTVVAIAACFAADAFVLRSGWHERQLTAGQFRRGYFEPFDDGVGIAADGAIRTGMVPTYVLDDRGRLAVPPGLVAVAPLAAAVRYEATRSAPLAPYVVIGRQVPLAPEQADQPAAPDISHLVETRTLALHDGRLRFDAWDPILPWGADAARLAALRDACAMPDGEASLAVWRDDHGLQLRLGRCALAEPLPGADTLQLAALAGPEWLTLAREPGWIVDGQVVWPVLAAIALKLALFWWALGLASTIAVSATLGVAAIFLPMPAMLMWPVMTLVGIAAAVVRIALLAWRHVPRRGRIPATGAALALIGAAIATHVHQPAEAARVAYSDRSSGGTCAVIGYSTVKGEGLRQQRGGIRDLLNERCPPCERRTAGIFAGGETLAWARDTFCGSPAWFGADGQVIFLGSVNDDYFWGHLSLPRLIIAAQQGSQSWRRSEGPAAAASLARIDAQATALRALMECARIRRSRFLFLHDFLVTDLAAGRTRERAAMLAHRRAVVEAAGGTFVDLSQVFGAEAGVTWFNDYVHLSRIGHGRVAELACQLTTGAAPTTPIAEVAPR